MDDDQKKIIDRLSSFKLELDGINSEAYKSNNIELAREKFDRLEERIISYLEKSISNIEAQRFKDVSYPINVNWWKTFDYRFKAKSAFLDALIVEIISNTDFLLNKGKNNMKYQEELKNDSQSIASNVSKNITKNFEENLLIKIVSIVLSIILFTAGFLLEDQEIHLFSFVFTLKNLLFSLSLITAFIFFVILLYYLVSDDKKKILKEKAGTFAVMLILVTILITLPMFVIYNNLNNNLIKTNDELINIKNEVSDLQSKLKTANNDLEDYKNKFKNEQDSFIDLKKITLGIENFKYFDLKNNYIIGFPNKNNNNNWIIENEWSTLNYMIFRDSAKKAFTRIAIIRNPVGSYRDVIDLTNQRYFNSNYKDNSIIIDGVQYIPLTIDNSKIINAKISNQDSAKIIYKASRNTDHGFSPPYYSYGESYQILNSENTENVPYIITLECFGYDDQYVEATSLFNDYNKTNGDFDFIIKNLFFGTREEYAKKFPETIIISSNGWGISFSSDDNLIGALDEVEKLTKLGFPAVVYKKDGRFDTFIGPYIDWEKANIDFSNVLKIKKVYIINLKDNYSKFIQRENYREYIED